MGWWRSGVWGRRGDRDGIAWTARRIIALASVVGFGVMGCSSPFAVAGSARAPEPRRGPITVELAFSTSFEVLPGGRCHGLGLTAAIVDGATVEIHDADPRPTDRDDVVTAAASVTYLRDDQRRGDDDGQYCVARFHFTPPHPTLRGYWFAFPAPAKAEPNVFPQGWGVAQVDPPDDGKITMTVYTCPDLDAPPERVCYR